MQEIKFADISLVELKGERPTPHCKKHGAMNKATSYEDGSGIWRCFSCVTQKNDTACRAGCQH